MLYVVSKRLEGKALSLDRFDITCNGAYVVRDKQKPLLYCLSVVKQD
jgi:hypothetical protein